VGYRSDHLAARKVHTIARQIEWAHEQLTRVATRLAETVFACAHDAEAAVAASASCGGDGRRGNAGHPTHDPRASPPRCPRTGYHHGLPGLSHHWGGRCATRAGDTGAGGDLGLNYQADCSKNTKARRLSHNVFAF
jgi:hypothetical protein